MQRRVRANRHVCPEHIIINRTDEPDGNEMRVRLRRFAGYFSFGSEFVQKFAPLLAKQIRAHLRTIAANDDKSVDAVRYEIKRRLPTPIARAEFLRTRRTENGAAFCQNARNIMPRHFADSVAARDHARIALVNRVHLKSRVQPRAYDGAHCRVHPLRIAAARDNADALHRRRAHFVSVTLRSPRGRSTS